MPWVLAARAAQQLQTTSHSPALASYVVPTLRTETWQVLETSGPLGVDKPQVGKWQSQTYVTCRVARCWKSPFYHLGSCECTYEAACLVCKKNRHQRAVWIVHSIPQGHSSNTRATRPSSSLSHAGTAAPPCVRKAPECKHMVLPGEGGRVRVLATRPLQAGKGRVSERRKAHSMPSLSNCWTLCFLKKTNKKINKQKNPNPRTRRWLPPILRSQENEARLVLSHQRSAQDFPFTRLPTCPNNQATSGMLPV